MIDEIKKVLLENNFKIDSHSDTEILLKSYIHYGNDVVKHLNGIFAFAIWDTQKNQIFLAIREDILNNTKAYFIVLIIFAVGIFL